FIERLIASLADSGHALYLFGVKTERIRPKTRVFNYGYENTPMYKLLYLASYVFLLRMFKPKAKQKLDRWLRQANRFGLYDRVKAYPVLWHQPDVFHVQWAKGLDEWLGVQAFGIKLVLRLRGAHINYSPIADTKLAAMYKENFPKVDGFHAVSKAIGVEAQKYGAVAARIHTIYSGLDLSSMSSPQLKPKNKVFQLISVGRPHWIKGYTYALDACKLLKDAGFDFEYTIVGGADAIEYQYQVHDLGLEDQVHLLGQQDFETVQTLIQEADLLLLPSIEEGIANVVLEAMALGILVLSTDCGGMDEVISPDINGFLVPIRDAQAMADTILH